MNIVVLAGGNSTEREISIVSGTQVTIALRQNGHRAVLLDVFTGAGASFDGELFPASYDTEKAAAEIRAFDGRIKAMSGDPSCPFFGKGVLDYCRASDIVFLALHGANGEDGRVQAAFDLLRIPYTGSGHLGSAIAMDKALTKSILSAGGVPTAPYFTLARKNAPYTFDEEVLARNGLSLPLVVKVNRGGSSVGVYICNTAEEYEQALKDAFLLEDYVVIEKYIGGREFSVGVIEGRALPVIEIAPITGFYDYKNKYTPGSTVETCPADLPEELTKKMQHYAEESYRLLRLTGYGRIDFLMEDDGSMFCLEANTLPGMTPTSLLPQEAAADGMDFPALCEELIATSIRRRK